jgi:hypothetical protein
MLFRSVIVPDVFTKTYQLSCFLCHSCEDTLYNSNLESDLASGWILFLVHAYGECGRLIVSGSTVVVNKCVN